MSRINRLGTIVRVPDGRVGTVVYNSLAGVGIKWGRHTPNPADFERTTGNTVREDMPAGWEWEPDAMLREPSMSKQLGMECVCKEYQATILDSEVTGQ